MASLPKSFKEHCLASLQSELSTWSAVHSTPITHALILDPSNLFSNTLLIVVCDGQADFDTITYKDDPEASEEGVMKTVKWNGVDYEIIGTVDEGEVELKAIEGDMTRMRVFFYEVGGLRDDAKFMNRPRNRLVEERRERKKEKKLKEKEKQQASEETAKAEDAENQEPASNPTETEEEAAQRKREKRKAKDKAEKARRKEDEAQDKAVIEAVARLHELRMHGVDILGAKILDPSTEEGRREIEEARQRVDIVVRVEEGRSNVDGE